MIILGVVLLCGCAAAPRPAQAVLPDGVVVAFVDGFHSGVVLARSAAPAELLPEGELRPWIAFHFGERRWITGQASGAGDAFLLAVRPGAGGMQVDGLDWWVHDRGGTDTARVRVWAFPATAAALEGVRARLRAWVEPGAPPAELRPGTRWWPTVRRWSLTGNCHDFTADILLGAGIRVDRPPIMLAAGMRASLDEAWELQDTARAGP